MEQCSPVTGPALYGLVLSTVSDPQEMIPFNPVVDRLGAESVPRTEAPLVTDWGSAGTSALRERMLFATAAAAAVAIPQQKLNAVTETVEGVVVVMRAVSCLSMNV